MGIFGCPHFEHIVGADHEPAIAWQAEQRTVSLDCDRTVGEAGEVCKGQAECERLDVMRVSHLGICNHGSGQMVQNVGLALATRWVGSSPRKAETVLQNVLCLVVVIAYDIDKLYAGRKAALEVDQTVHSFSRPHAHLVESFYGVSEHGRISSDYGERYSMLIGCEVDYISAKIQSGVYVGSSST